MKYYAVIELYGSILESIQLFHTEKNAERWMKNQAKIEGITEKPDHINEDGYISDCENYHEFIISPCEVVN